MKIAIIGTLAFALVTAGLIGGYPARAATVNTNSDSHFGPFHTIADPDNGSCGLLWANDTFDRFFTVHNNGDGTFLVKEEFKNGSFKTTGLGSPGACESTPNHGLTVGPGINGDMRGTFQFDVVGGTFDPNGCTAPADCASTTGFVLAVLGSTNYCGNVCKYNFEYNSNDTHLQYHHWQDNNPIPGAANTTDKFNGDIANQ